MILFQREINDKILNINQLKLEVHDTYKNDENLTTTSEAVNNGDVINKAYLDEELRKTNGHIAYI